LALRLGLFQRFAGEEATNGQLQYVARPLPASMPS
jgi:hypothetical protein